MGHPPERREPALSEWEELSSVSPDPGFETSPPADASHQDRLVAIVGPTASGKSALALCLAQRLGGEIVGADSRQIYRHMDIGTAKPSPRERASVPHHVIDVVDPDEGYSVAAYIRDADRAIRDIQDRGKLPILVGGSGQYVWGLIEGWQVPEVPPDRRLRKALEARATKIGAKALHAELAEVAPEAAARIDGRNVRRVIRALEVHEASKGSTNPPSKKPPGYAITVLGLTMARGTLYRGIDERVDRMIADGWSDEVRGLLEMGFGPELPCMSGLGYRELVEFLAGEVGLEDAVERIKRRTHRFARGQHAWFKKGDHRIRWLDAAQPLEALEAEAVERLRGPVLK